jgi:hypothetical protein
LAERLLAGRTSDQERVGLAFRLATGRPPKPAESKVLLSLRDQQLAVYRASPAAALKLLQVGESPHDEKFDAAELAAWTMVASAILNLDETVTKN